MAHNNVPCIPFVTEYMQKVILFNTIIFNNFYESFMSSTKCEPNNFCIKTDTTDTPTFKILSLNCRSLRRIFFELTFFIENSILSFDLISLSETWLDGALDHLFMLNNYSFFNFNRKSKKGGGVAIFVRDSLTAIERLDLVTVTEVCEIVAIEILQNSPDSKNTIIINLYKPPCSNNVEFLEFIESFLFKISKEQKNIYFMGDFNININLENPTSISLLNTMSSNFLFPTNPLPTRTTLNTSTNIDLIFTNNISSFNGGVIDIDFSDHYPIFLSQKLQTKKNTTFDASQVTFHNTSNKNLMVFKFALMNKNWMKF